MKNLIINWIYTKFLTNIYYIFIHNYQAFIYHTTHDMVYIT